MTDAGHLGPGVPFVLTGMYLVADSVIPFCPERSMMQRYYDKLIALFTVIAGSLITFLCARVVYRCEETQFHHPIPVKHCYQSNWMHTLVGAFMLQGGIVYLLLTYKSHTSVNFIPAIVYSIIGVMFTMHGQDNEYLTRIHLWVGYSFSATGIASTIGLYYPKWRIVAGFFLLGGTILFCTASPTLFQILRKEYLFGATATVILAYNIAALWLVIVLISQKIYHLLRPKIISLFQRILYKIQNS